MAIACTQQYGVGRLSVIDTRKLETIASIYTGKRCHVVALTHDNRHAWVANIGDNTVSIVDTATYRVVGTIATGKGQPAWLFRVTAVLPTSAIRRQGRRRGRHGQPQGHQNHSGGR